MYEQKLESWATVAEDSIARGHRPPPLATSGGGQGLLVLFAAVVLFLAAAWMVNWLYGALIFGWSELPRLLTPIPARLLMAASVFGIGAALYWLRENWRLLYAALELGAAAATAFNSAGQLSSTGERATGALALVAATYIVVRGFDNMAKFRAESAAAPPPSPSVKGTS